MLQLYVIFFLLPELGLSLPRLVAGVLGLALNYSAYEAEIYRAGLQAVPRGQMDTALARTVSETTEGGAVAVAAQRKALRVGAESIDTFRRYMALYVREQALCMYSDALIANLQTYWNAQNRVL